MGEGTHAAPDGSPLTQLDLLWLLFLAYSMCGWVIESTYCSLHVGRPINRGFLNGPYIPIYGCGAMIAALGLSGLDRLGMVFCAGGLASCGLEYVTSWAMERAYHARWWDYSDKPLNINGRVWIGGFAEFGACCVAVVLVNPYLLDALEGLPHPLLKLVGAASLALFATDAAITVTGMAGLRQKMDYLREESLLRLASLREGLPALTTPDMDELIRGRIRAYVEGAAARVHATTRQLSPLPSLREAARWPSLPSLDELARTFAGMLSDQERRVLRAFPQARLSDYRRLLEEVRERLTR
ncbi:MAG: putative ABC transporter permease [Olsenella profusa]